MENKVEINITPFKFKHFPQLIELHETNKSEVTSLLTYKSLPKIGYIATIGSIPVAAGFLRRLEPNFAQIDTLVSNAYCGAILRNDGIKLVVNTLVEEAKRLKLEGIICHTQDTGILKRAEDLGFHIVPQTIIALSLQEITE